MDKIYKRFFSKLSINGLKTSILRNFHRNSTNKTFPYVNNTIKSRLIFQFHHKNWLIKHRNKYILIKFFAQKYVYKWKHKIQQHRTKTFNSHTQFSIHSFKIFFTSLLNQLAIKTDGSLCSVYRGFVNLVKQKNFFFVFYFFG